MSRGGGIVQAVLLSAGIAAIGGGVGVEALRGQAPPGEADREEDGRWLPWTGCWEPVRTGEAAEDSELVCIRPAGEGAELVTLHEGAVRSVEPLIPDGVARSFEVEGCTGMRSAEFSADAERIYLTESADCGGLAQETRGVIAMIAPDEWIDIRGAEGRNEAWSRSYRLVPDPQIGERGDAGGAAAAPAIDSGRDLTVRMMRWRASEPSSLDDLIEVSAQLPEGVTRTWVAEQLDPFELDARGLVRLADAGVPEGVIDVAVAHAFPGRFVLEEGTPSERSGTTAAGRGRYGAPGYGFYGSGFYGPGYLGSYRSFGVHGLYRPRRILPHRTHFIPGIGGRGNDSSIQPIPGRGYVGRGSATGGGSSDEGRSTGRTARRRGGGDGG